MKRLFAGFIILLVCLVWVAPAFADPYEARPHEWRNTQKFARKVIFKNGADVDAISAIKRVPVLLTFVSGVGFTVSAPEDGDIFLVPTAATNEASAVYSSGTTVLIPQPSADNVGWCPTIVNTSGTSPMVIYITGQEALTPDGIMSIGASGTTILYSYDAEGDSVTLGYLEAAGTGVSVYVISDIIDGT